MTKELIEKLHSLTKCNCNTKTILEQLIMDNQRTVRFMSWGVSLRLNVNDKGLLLKVNGRHHKSYVFITLTSMDYYEVHIISNRGNVLKTYDMVDSMDLNEIIDNHIENIPQNKF
jgi:hypothetical protein